MHAVGRVEETPSELGLYADRSSGLTRRTIVDAGAGSVHMAVAICELERGSAVARHVHAFEQALYVLDGSLELGVAGRMERLGPDEYAFLEAGLAHEERNAGDAPVRWLEISAPQPGAPGLDDTAFVDSGFADLPSDGAFRRGRFEEGRLPPPSGNILEGFGAANVAGASLKMLIDQEFGASQFNFFVVEYVPGGAIKPHDHPFEEAYVFVSGQIEATLDGQTYTLRTGDWCWTGVGGPHSFANRSDAPVRWIETQAPQPPARHQARFFGEWTAALEWA